MADGARDEIWRQEALSDLHAGKIYDGDRVGDDDHQTEEQSGDRLDLGMNDVKFIAELPTVDADPVFVGL